MERLLEGLVELPWLVVQRILRAVLQLARAVRS